MADSPQPQRTLVDVDLAVAGEPAGIPDAATKKRNNTVIWVLIISAFTVILNETIMGVALPHLMEDLRISAISAQWLTTAFLLTMSVVIPTTGFLLQRYPTRALYLIAMSVFVLGTALAASAPGFEVLLVARVVQACGTAVMLPLLITTVMNLEPPETRGKRMGLISVVIAVAPAIGPTISGLILSVLPWRFLFVAVLPIVIAVLAFGFRHMVTTNEPSHAPIDIPSIPLTAIGFGSLVFGLSKIGEVANGDASGALIPLAIGLVGVGLFIWRQLVLQRTDGALLDLRTFLIPTFVVTVVLFVVAMAGLFGTIILLPLYMQGALHLSVLASGLLLLPGGLAMGLLSTTVGRLYDRLGPRPLLVPGLTIVATSLWAFAALLRADSSWWILLACHVVLSLGLACVFTPLFTSSLASLPARLYSHGSATVSTVQQVAGAAGTALFISTMTAVALRHTNAGASDEVALTAGIRVAMVIGASLVTLGIPLAVFVRKGSADPGDAPAGH
ncbi:MAG: multidrug efflux MFS transporter [Demequinaceae bacterium]|nr:multidrug efflux MFS transporter [Demequinaceae bacterium]